MMTDCLDSTSPFKWTKLYNNACLTGFVKWYLLGEPYMCTSSVYNFQNSYLSLEAWAELVYISKLSKAFLFSYLSCLPTILLI